MTAGKRREVNPNTAYWKLSFTPMSTRYFLGRDANNNLELVYDKSCNGNKFSVERFDHGGRKVLIKYFNAFDASSWLWRCSFHFTFCKKYIRSKIIMLILLSTLFGFFGHKSVTLRVDGRQLAYQGVPAHHVWFYGCSCCFQMLCFRPQCLLGCHKDCERSLGDTATTSEKFWA